MFSLLRNRFGIPGVISVIALVFAMLGGAYAATNDNPLAGASKQKRHHKKKKHKKKGPKYVTKAQVLALIKKNAGPKGDKGDAGSNGSNGSNGAPGEAGAAGAPGAPGQSVHAEAIPTEEFEERCEERGGAEVLQGGQGAGEGLEVCNGSPWPGGGTLAAGATETGSWIISTSAIGGDNLSFPIQLSAPLDGTHVAFVPPGNTSTAHCSASAPDGPGGSVSSPKADSGYLCVYQGNATAVSGSFIHDPTKVNLSDSGASIAGAVLTTSGGAATGNWGTWAVTESE